MKRDFVRGIVLFDRLQKAFTYGTLDLDNNLITGSDLLAFRREADHSILGKGRDGEEDHGGEELHYEGCECVVYSRIKRWIVCFL